MIRFSAFLVAAALGLLVAGVVTSKLTLVYVAIGVSGVALLALGAGALIKRNELFGESAEPAGPELARPASAGGYVPQGQPEPQVAPWEAQAPAASAWAAKPAAGQSAPSHAGYLPTEQPLPIQPVKAQPADAAATAWGSDFPFPPERPFEHPPERQADVQRRPAAFTPRPPAGPPSPPVPGVPAPAPGTWEWPLDAPATQPLREVRRPEPSPPTAPHPATPPRAAQSQPPPQDQQAVPDELPVQEDSTPQDQPQAPPDEQAPPPVEATAPVEAAAPVEAPAPADDHATEDQPQDKHPAEDQQTQQLPIAATAATEPPPAPPDAAAPAPPDAAPPPLDAAPSQPDAAAPDAPEPASATVDLQREVTVVPGVPRYHNPHCLLIRFMGQGDLDQMTLDAARRAGCTPCRACLPDQPEANPDL